MNKIILKQISILSVMLGVALGIVTLIPFVGRLAFFALLGFSSTAVIIFMLRLGLLRQLPVRESVVLGAVIGFISFVAFCAVYLPVMAVLGRFFSINSGIAIALRTGSFGIIVLLVVFMGIFAATINAFSAFLTFYLMEFLQKNTGEHL